MRINRSLVLLILVAGIFNSSCRSGADIIRARKFIEPVKFEKKEWDNTDMGTRPGMARALIRDHTLIGKSRNEVLELLGTKQGGKTDSPHKIEYILEYIHLGNTDPAAIEEFDIILDRDLKVIKVEINLVKQVDWID